MVITRFLIPRFASAGGIHKFSKKLHDQGIIPSISYDNGPQMIQQIQNQLEAGRYQPNIMHLLNMFEADSINLVLQRFATQHAQIVTAEDMSELKLRNDLTFSDFNNLSEDVNNSWFDDDNKKRGFVHILNELPKLNDLTGRIDIGLYYLT